METESISKPGLFFMGDLFVFSGDQLEVGDELGTRSPRSHPQAAPCNVWAGDGVGKQSETSFQGFIYSLEGEKFTACRFCNAGLMSENTSRDDLLLGEENKRYPYPEIRREGDFPTICCAWWEQVRP